jgi:hypothetical protein
MRQRKCELPYQKQTEAMQFVEAQGSKTATRVGALCLYCYRIPPACLRPCCLALSRPSPLEMHKPLTLTDHVFG